MKNSNIEARRRTPKSIFNAISNFIGDIIEVIANIKNILKIFEPMMFPTAISDFPLYAATAEVASSGRDVPIASMVNPINLSES